MVVRIGPLGPHKTHMVRDAREKNKTPRFKASATSDNAYGGCPCSFKRALATCHHGILVGCHWCDLPFYGFCGFGRIDPADPRMSVVFFFFFLRAYDARYVWAKWADPHNHAGFRAVRVGQSVGHWWADRIGRVGHHKKRGPDHYSGPLVFGTIKTVFLLLRPQARSPCRWC